MIREHAATGMEQEEFDRKAHELDERFQKADGRLNRLNEEKQDRLRRVSCVRRFVEDLCRQGECSQAGRNQAGTIDVWNEQAWRMLVTQVTVHADGSTEFLFKGENRITVRAE